MSASRNRGLFVVRGVDEGDGAFVDPATELGDGFRVVDGGGRGRVAAQGRVQGEPLVEALQAQVIDSSQEQSTTAVLDKINGAVLVADRQRQARMQFVADIVQLLLIDTKRARDTEATALNMQLTTWREGRPVNDAFVAGTADALGTWRQP